MSKEPEKKPEDFVPLKVKKEKPGSAAADNVAEPEKSAWWAGIPILKKLAEAAEERKTEKANRASIDDDDGEENNIS